MPTRRLPYIARNSALPLLYKASISRTSSFLPTSVFILHIIIIRHKYTKYICFGAFYDGYSAKTHQFYPILARFMVDIPPKHISFTRFWRVSLEYSPPAVSSTQPGVPSLFFTKKIYQSLPMNFHTPAAKAPPTKGPTMNIQS
ncbi:MAG: hypothetical protein MR865_04685, partial [Bacteroidales bacterium]|nr:hypothetical protein [Bacteroidales bacterium]